MDNTTATKTNPVVTLHCENSGCETTISFDTDGDTAEASFLAHDSGWYTETMGEGDLCSGCHQSWLNEWHY